MSAKKWSHDLYIYARALHVSISKLLNLNIKCYFSEKSYILKKKFNIACQYLDIMDEYLLFEYLHFNIHFSPCVSWVDIITDVVMLPLSLNWFLNLFVTLGGRVAGCDRLVFKSFNDFVRSAKCEFLQNIYYMIKIIIFFNILKNIRLKCKFMRFCTILGRF